jgi:hypothetical protein
MRKLNLEIKRDESPESPREWGNTVGHMVLFHNRMNLGDDKKGLTVDMARNLETRMTDPRYGVCLPIYAYQHGGITISTEPFSDPWDSGKLGFIYASKEMMRENFHRKTCTKKMMQETLGFLQQEVKAYDQYLTGDVYGYVIKDEAGEVVDSCWGFYGLDLANAEGIRALEFENKREAQEDKKIDACMAL